MVEPHLSGCQSYGHLNLPGSYLEHQVQLLHGAVYSAHITHSVHAQPIVIVHMGVKQTEHGVDLHYTD